MTSPLRFEDVSFLDEERLSPIKVPGLPAPTSAERHLVAASKDALSPSKLLAKHPHGLTAKHDARRNTIHTAATPNRRPDSAGGSLTAPFKVPLTSPRLPNATVSLSSMQRAKASLDQRVRSNENSSPTLRSHKFSSNKENPLYDVGIGKKPARLSSESGRYERSSPVAHFSPRNSAKSSPRPSIHAEPSSPVETAKRHVSEDSEPRKIAKIVSNSSFTEAANEDGFKTDPSSGFSPKKSSKSSNRSHIIDDDSDSDPEDYGRIESNVSQTMLHTTTQKPYPSRIESEHTQLGRIGRGLHSGDYVTPQRPTEPVARSPETNQQVRIHEMEDDTKNGSRELTSPLKMHKVTDSRVMAFESIVEDVLDSDAEINNIENEPTINFLMSPNSKPVFTVSQIKDIQSSHDKEVMDLEKALEEAHLEISEMAQQFTATSRAFEQEIKVLKLDRKKLLANESLWAIQLKQAERELGSTAKRLKIQETTISQLDAKLAKSETKVETYAHDLEILSREVQVFKSDDLKLKSTINECELQIKTLERNMDALENELKGKESELATSVSNKLELDLKVESLLQEKEDLLDASKLQKGQVSELQQLVEELKKADGQKEEALAELRATIKDKDEQLKAEKEQIVSLNSKFAENIKETEALQADINKIEQEYKAEAEQLRKEKTELKAENDELKSEISTTAHIDKSLREKIDSMHSEKDKLMEDINYYKTEVHKLRATNSEKDDIISGDTKKMDELVKQVQKQKQAIDDHKKLESALTEKIAALESEGAVAVDNTALLAEIADLKEQVTNGQKKTDLRIHEVAEQLYYEYSKKHELKIAQLKNSYRVQLEALAIELKTKDREIDSLEKKLADTKGEVDQLLKLLEQNRIENGSLAKADPKRRLSPKKSGGLKKLTKF